jgi:hypothetical protein
VPYRLEDEQAARRSLQCCTDEINFTPAFAIWTSDMLAFIYEGAVTFRPL